MDKLGIEEDSLAPIRCLPHEPLYAGGVTCLISAFGVSKFAFRMGCFKKMHHVR